jgi:hypothetical protein
LHGQIRDGIAQIAGLLIKCLVLSFEFANFCIASGDFFLRGGERGFGLRKIPRDLD